MSPRITPSISRRYMIQASHQLPNVPEGHKCGRLHGHTYELEVVLRGPIVPDMGWVCDFALLDAVVNTLVVGVLDHRHLNEIPGLENPTSEVICWWVWSRLSSTAMVSGDIRLARVALYENARSMAAIDADVA